MNLIHPGLQRRDACFNLGTVRGLKVAVVRRSISAEVRRSISSLSPALKEIAIPSPVVAPTHRAAHQECFIPPDYGILWRAWDGRNCHFLQDVEEPLGSSEINSSNDPNECSDLAGVVRTRAICSEKVAQNHNWQNLQLCSLPEATTFRGRDTPMQTATTLKGKELWH